MADNGASRHPILARTARSGVRSRVVFAASLRAGLSAGGPASL